jgi:hypothetical protein
MRSPQSFGEEGFLFGEARAPAPPEPEYIARVGATFKATCPAEPFVRFFEPPESTDLVEGLSLACQHVMGSKGPQGGANKSGAPHRDPLCNHIAKVFSNSEGLHEIDPQSGGGEISQGIELQDLTAWRRAMWARISARK